MISLKSSQSSMNPTQVEGISTSSTVEFVDVHVRGPTWTLDEDGERDIFL